jgi:uncharacterized OsmC-like protein
MATEKIINGIDVQALGKAMHELRQDPKLGDFRFRSFTRWIEGAYNRTTISSFYGAGKENDDRRFDLVADEPHLLLGEDRGPNPVEYLLDALASCLTSSLVYHAAARGIRIDACECELEGSIDLRGYLGVSEDVRKGYQRIAATFRVVSDASAEQLERCARFSPVLDVVSRGTEVALAIEKKEEAQVGPASATGAGAPGGEAHAS